MEDHCRTRPIQLGRNLSPLALQHVPPPLQQKWLTYFEKVLALAIHVNMVGCLP